MNAATEDSVVHPPPRLKGQHWRKLLHIHALMDEFVIQTIAAHVQSAHEGLLLQCRVFGTVAFHTPGMNGFQSKAAARSSPRLKTSATCASRLRRSARPPHRRAWVRLC